VTRRIRKALLATLAIAIVQVACSETDGSPRIVNETVSGDWIRVYFTAPQYPDDESWHTGGLDEELAAVIAQAETSIDLAAYDFDLASVADALVDARTRGVTVRIVVETDNADEQATVDLEEAGIPLVDDRRDSGLMHNKFVIIDRVWVWTGSWNLTENGTYRNNNVAVLIASPALADNYAAEFEEMFGGAFGPASPANTPNPRIIIEVDDRQKSVLVENYFAPEDKAAAHIIAEIGAAQERIRFLAFTFTSQAIADAMLDRARAGVVVQGVIEDRNAESDYSQYDHLKREIHDILPDGNPYIMHHKVIILDDETVILGSYNLTNSAEENNDENVLIIHDAEVAALFVEEFGRVYEAARTASQ
jgi:phosphatidylserine/phosphatidylglycerophosphate/cardiolipin synthase-like enzyme